MFLIMISNKLTKHPVSLCASQRPSVPFRQEVEEWLHENHMDLMEE